MNKGMMASLAKMSSLSQKQIENEMALKPELIRTFFTGLKTQYGSIEIFLQLEKGIGPKEITLLRKKYTK